MKQNVKLLNEGSRLYAIVHDLEIPVKVKTVPVRFKRMVLDLGFIDIRQPKRLRLSSEERLLLFLHSTTIPSLVRMYPDIDHENIQIVGAKRLQYRDERSDEYAVSISRNNNPGLSVDVIIPHSYYKGLKITKQTIKSL